MKISELINRLESINRTNGDLEIGMRDYEFDKFIEIESAAVVESNRNDPECLNSRKDDESLGRKFVRIW